MPSSRFGLYSSRMRSPSKPLIVLASASPRRSALLTQIGVEHRVMPVDIDESALAVESPAVYVQRLAAAKAEHLWSQLPPSDRLPVLGADTSVALGEQILGKPLDRADGIRMLRLLSGRTHQVLTAVALRWEHACEVRLNVSHVSFRSLEDAEIEAYWSSGEPSDKAGGYAIQGAAALFIERIAGSYSGIVGLPLYETGELLKIIGWSLSESKNRNAVAAQETRG
jgi:septum formation protein